MFLTNGFEISAANTRNELPALHNNGRSVQTHSEFTATGHQSGFEKGTAYRVLTAEIGWSARQRVNCIIVIIQRFYAPKIQSSLSDDRKSLTLFWVVTDALEGHYKLLGQLWQSSCRQRSSTF